MGLPGFPPDSAVSSMHQKQGSGGREAGLGLTVQGREPGAQGGEVYTHKTSKPDPEPLYPLATHPYVSYRVDIFPPSTRTTVYPSDVPIREPFHQFPQTAPPVVYGTPWYVTVS